jgi:hypothetical protein
MTLGSNISDRLTPNLKAKISRRKLDEGAEILLDFVATMARHERTFGPSTALTEFGRIYKAISERPRWLAHGKPKSCFLNATAIVLVRDDVAYVEGYALDPNIPIPLQHAWLVDSNGRVIDPTWADNKGHVYYGIAFKRDFLADALSKAGGECGMLNSGTMRRVRLTRESFGQGICGSPASAADYASR